jgi:uncharacterized membrane protein YphA (DoxX/SURF4 family)
MKYIILLLRVSLVIIFLMAAFAKLTAAEQMVTNFTNWGLGIGLMYITGVLELLLAFGLASRKHSRLSALVLAIMMIIATIIHLINGESFVLSFGLLFLLWFVAKNSKSQVKTNKE